MENKEVINALEDMTYQIEHLDGVVFYSDRADGKTWAGAHYYGNADDIRDYLHCAETEDNSDFPGLSCISYIYADDFKAEEVEVIDEILRLYGEYIKRDEIIGFVVCQYDEGYTFYMAHEKSERNAKD